jgi:hypothetical protein
MDGPQDCTRKNCPTKGTYVGEHTINFRTTRKLQERFSNCKKSQDDTKTGHNMTIEEKIHENLTVHLGGNCFESDIIKAIKKVIRRDWKNIERGEIGQIFVPKIFFSKNSDVIDHAKFKEVVDEIEAKSQKNSEEKKKMNKQCQVKGEDSEKKVFTALELIFKKLNEDVLVIYGLKFMMLTDQGEEEIRHFEKDFIIINLTQLYVMSLEVKSSLSTNPLNQAKKQLHGSKKLLVDEWLGATFTKKSGWVFLGVAAFHEKAKRGYKSRFCETCQPYIIVGLDDGFEDKFVKIAKNNQISDPRGGYEKAKEEFLEAAEHMLFFAAFEPVITSSVQVTKKIVSNLKKAGSAENIDVWRCLTPNQQPLLKGKLKKLIFISAPSTGKTTMMTSEALYIAEKPGEKVAFVIPGTFGYNQKTLLAMSLENEFKDVGNIEVSCLKRTTANGIDYQDLLRLIKTRESCHYFIDELHLQTMDDINVLKEISQLCENKTLWITISSKSNEVLYDTLKSEFANFYISDDLVYPLRNTSTISKYAYSLKDGK